MSIFDPDPHRETGRPVVILDIEASSLPMPGSYPIEVGIAYVETGASRSWLIRPPQPWLERGVWDPASEKVHGIPRGLLLAEGRPLEGVRNELTQAVAGHAVFSDAVTADGFWLWTLYGGTPPFILERLGDFIRQLTAPLGTGARDAVINACNAAHDRFPQHHRAEPDARRWAEVIRVLASLA
jgi:hypothetical protein